MKLPKRIIKLVDAIKTSFWFTPLLMVFLSVSMALFLASADATMYASNSTWYSQLSTLDHETLKTLLSTIATSMITVTSIAFSITIVVLTLASSQFGPRLIRNFMNDPGTQFVLGTFVSNFSYCVVLMYAMSLESNQGVTFRLSVLWCLLATGFSVLMLIYFIHHVALSIRADHVINDVSCSIDSAIEQLKGNDESTVCKTDEGNEPFDDAPITFEVKAPSNGYLQVVDQEWLFEKAHSHDIRITLAKRPGDLIIKGITLAEVAAKKPVAEEIQQELYKGMIVGSQRTPIQDPEYAVHQLVEIAVRALSPGINDPYTAITCVDKLTSLLCEIAQIHIDPQQWQDNEGVTRLRCCPHTFIGIARSAFDQIRQYGITSVAVTIRLLEGMNNLLTLAKSEEVNEFVLEQLNAINKLYASQPFSGVDHDDFQKLVTTLQTKLNS